MGKIVISGMDALNKLVDGARKTYEVVAPTLGAAGRFVAIRTAQNEPYLTKDGIISIKSLELTDPVMDMGNKLIRAASDKTSKDAGDATTTTAILAYNILEKSVAMLQEENIKPINLIKGMDMAVKAACDKIKENAIPIKEDGDEIEKVAIISANNDEDLGSKIGALMKEIGKDGIVVVNDSTTGETNFEVANGLIIEKGWSTPYIINNYRKQTCEVYNADVLVTDETITDIDQVKGFLEHIIQTKHHGLLVCPVLGGEALGLIVSNVQRGNFTLGVVLAPNRGELGHDILNDIAMYCGARLVTENTGKSTKHFDVKDLGFIGQGILGRNDSLLIGGDGDVTDRIEMLREAAKESEEAKKRLANMTGKTSVFYVWADTPIELSEKKDRVDDAIHAVRSAMEEGIVPGGGVCLYDISKTIEKCPLADFDIATGYNIIIKAMRYPVYTILANAGYDIEKVKTIVQDIKWDMGYDVLEKQFCNMVECGIIDPAKSVRVSMVNAFSVVKTFLNTECVVYEEPK